MWGVEPSNRWDWAGLKADIQEHGLRNSLLLAPMPTASTSQILGWNEAIEPFTRNLYVRRTLAGEFICINRHLTKDLEQLGLWTPEIIEHMLADKGSIQFIDEIPQEVKDLYKTAYEIKTSALIDMAADRGAFVCQSQSFNIFIEHPNYPLLNTIHFYSWQKGLKTGMYYLRSKSEQDAVMFTVSHETVKRAQQRRLMGLADKKDSDEEGSGGDESDDQSQDDSSAPSKWVCTDDICISCGS
jgi:ribonucleotide reductase alpha subunit